MNTDFPQLKKYEGNTSDKMISISIVMSLCRIATRSIKGDRNMLWGIDHEQGPASPICAHAKLYSHATNDERRSHNVAIQAKICCERSIHTQIRLCMNLVFICACFLIVLLESGPEIKEFCPSHTHFRIQF